jgi:UDP-glucose 4-epimerase
MRVLITGGAGFIGSHTLLQLLRSHHEVLVFDSFYNSSPEVLHRVKRLASANFEVYEGDIRNENRLDEAFASFKPAAVLHLAGLKAVGESTREPLEYYSQNVAGSVALLRAMERHDCHRIVFSSSATVYGDAKYLPYDENHPLEPNNPYGRTKHFVERIIQDWTEASHRSSAVLLRYFNPVGAHSSGQIGEDPSGTPNNLVPYIAQVAVGRQAYINIFGSDYETRDGTGERDYVHIEDLARAHLAALDFTVRNKGCEAINVGTGTGITVLEMVRAFERSSGKKISYKMVPRRAGDVACSFASVEKAERLMGWKAQLSVEDMCNSAWLWQSNNPNGFD